MWQSILKANPITVGSSKVRLEPLPDDDDCNRQLKAYFDKVKNMKPKLKVEGVSFSKDVSALANIRKYKSQTEKMWEIKRHMYNTLPEEVACKALEILNSGSTKKRGIVGEYIVLLRHKENRDISEFTYETKRSDLHILKNKEIVFHLGHVVSIAGSKRDNNIREVETRWWK